MTEKEAIAIAVVWIVSGALPLLKWKFSEAEVTLLDLFACILLGALFGSLIPVVWALHSVKLKGGTP